MNSIAAQAKTKTTVVEKAKFVHDYLINHSEYDYTLNSKTMYDLLINGKGTCGSYALSFKDAMDKLGIECTVVLTDDLSHCWNQIKIDGKWYNVDVTWDENYSINGTADSTLFRKSDSYFKVTGHKTWKSVNLCNVDK